MMGKTVEQCSGEFLIAQNLDLLGEGKIGRDDCRAWFITLGQRIEEQLATGALEGHEAEFIDD
jgi:hypothetical protein